MTSSTLVRVGVMGAHSTGKSLLMRRIERELRGRGIPVARTGRLGRRAALVPLPKMQHHTVASTTWVIATGIADEIAAAARLEDGSAQVILADRACWDALAYFRAAQEWRKQAAPRADREALHQIASAHGRTYGLLMATVLDPDIPVERKRDYDARYRMLVDRHTHALLNEGNIRHIRVTSDPASQEAAVERALQLCVTEAPA